MALDGFVISTIVDELNKKIINGKIEKIYQPESDEINILIRCFGENYKLLISANSNYPRIHLSTTHKTNPPSPPMFCMLMRKYLQGGKIIKVSQKDFERIITIDIETYDELGLISIKQLIVEIMGKHSNIILIDLSENKILDSIKRISSAINRYREILPGKTYISPPSQNKINPMMMDFEQFYSLIHQSPLDKPIYKILYTSLQGVSPLLARETCYRGKIDDENTISHLSEENFLELWNELKNLLHILSSKEFTPNIIISKDDHHVVDFYSIILEFYKSIYQSIPFDSISKVLEEFYIKKDLYHRLHQKSIDLRKLIHHGIDKLYKKKQKLKEEWDHASNSEIYRIYGELLTTYLHDIKRGEKEIEVVNYYDENGKKILIPLDIKLTPSQNAQMYFKKYTKSKNALKEIKHQLEETNYEIQYFESLFHSLENISSLEDIEEIRTELMEEGYIRKRKTSRSNKKNISSEPMTFISSDGFKILIGKNNKQNDMLTLKIASKKDLWFHTKDIPGSHVIIVCNQKNIPESTILQAAELAAFHSKGKMSSQVPVDYTEVKNVKKPKGAKPGMVIYNHHKTLYVNPKNIFKK